VDVVYVGFMVLEGQSTRPMSDVVVGVQDSVIVVYCVLTITLALVMVAVTVPVAVAVAVAVSRETCISVAVLV